MGNRQKMRSIYNRKQNAVYYAMSTIKQKKRSRIKMPTPIGVRTS